MHGLNYLSSVDFEQWVVKDNGKDINRIDGFLPCLPCLPLVEMKSKGEDLSKPECQAT